MTKIIELAHMLGEEIAKSDEIKNLEAAKSAYESNKPLQAKLSEFETDRKLLTEEFCKPQSETDERAIADLRARIEELTGEISTDPCYITFAEAQKALNDLMASVNAEIKFCITGERPVSCTHDCSTCGGCSH
ncbi:MAG: YlbF family regulator [Clostridia bacterium]|nr:YlbF family regulator [Clostridia bacterium]